MQFTMTVNMDGASFGDDSYDQAHELGRIMERVATRMRNGRTEGPCVNIDGNTVGEWSISDD